MTGETLRILGLDELKIISIENKDIKFWKDWLAAYDFDARYPDDDYAWLTSVLALKAVNAGNFGIGCVLIDGNGNIVARGHNEVFHPYFRSDRHAEMVVMDEFEDTHHKTASMDGYTLYTSLESCPMCLARLITSGIDRVLHVAPDKDAGMAHKMRDLPPIWIDLAKERIFKQAKCTQKIIEAAFQIFLLNSNVLNEKLRNR
jgi:cytosine deaminase